MSQKGTWNGLFLSGLLQVEKYQGTKHNYAADGEEDGKHRHAAISGYIPYTKTYFGSMRKQNTICSTLSVNSGLKCFMEIEPAGSFLKTCVAFSLLFVEMGYSGRFPNPLIIHTTFLDISNGEGKTFCLNFIFK